jgi:hypothetical protein
LAGRTGITSVYLGTGAAGELVAAADARCRLARETAARELAAEEAQLREVEASVLELCTAATLLARAALVAQGLHRHGGQWRKRRHAPQPSDHPDAGGDPGAPAPADHRQTLDTVRCLSELAERGDPGALRQLRRVLASRPGVWKSLSELGRQVEEALIQRVSSPNLLLAECLRLHLQAMKGELGGPSPSPAELLVIESLAASWVWLNHLDALTIQVVDSLSPARVRMLLSLGSPAHRRFSRAVRMLMTLRRLQRPPASSFGLARPPDRPPPRPAAAARAVAGTVPVAN